MDHIECSIILNGFFQCWVFNYKIINTLVKAFYCPSINITCKNPRAFSIKP